MRVRRRERRGTRPPGLEEAAGPFRGQTRRKRCGTVDCAPAALALAQFAEDDPGAPVMMDSFWGHPVNSLRSPPVWAHVHDACLGRQPNLGVEA